LSQISHLLKEEPWIDGFTEMRSIADREAAIFFLGKSMGG
jgi:hypothetical protein